MAAGSSPRTLLGGAYSIPPDPVAGFKQRGKEREKEVNGKRKREGRKKKGREKKGGRKMEEREGKVREKEDGRGKGMGGDRRRGGIIPLPAIPGSATAVHIVRSVVIN